MRGLIYALAIPSNGIVAVWWGLLWFAATQQHDFAFDTGAASLLITPIAAAFALVAMTMMLTAKR